MNRSVFRWLSFLFVGLFLLFLLAAAWYSVGMGPGDAAWTALQPGLAVQVAVEPDLLIFTPADGGSSTGLVFYPGARVDYRAYAPPLRALAEDGVTVFVPRMPLNLALLGGDAAGGVISAHPEIVRWVVAGHSLGGVAAAAFAAQHPEVDGLVLWAAYPQDDALRETGLPVLSIYGELDALTTPETVAAQSSRLPADTAFVEIPGGNHAQFGDYGAQSGDGAAAIPPEVQWAQVVAAMQAWLSVLPAE